jgi:signal transduction histidine kinase
MSEQCRGFRQVFDFIASSFCAVLAARRKPGDAGRYAFRKAKRSALIVADSVLQQVLLNLVLNAVDAMDAIKAEARELSISTEQTPTKGILVAVRDSGPGIDPKNLERVFEAFYTTKSNGVGMGLAICRSLIEAHGGRLWAEANELRGAVFRFTLPNAENS